MLNDDELDIYMRGFWVKDIHKRMYQVLMYEEIGVIV